MKNSSFAYKVSVPVRSTAEEVASASYDSASQTLVWSDGGKAPSAYYCTTVAPTNVGKKCVLDSYYGGRYCTTKSQIGNTKCD